jgi:hypothetical protein
MLFLDWKLALLSMKISVLCTGKTVDRSVTQGPARNNSVHVNTCSMFFTFQST